MYLGNEEHHGGQTNGKNVTANLVLDVDTSKIKGKSARTEIAQRQGWNWGPLEGKTFYRGGKALSRIPGRDQTEISSIEQNLTSKGGVVCSCESRNEQLLAAKEGVWMKAPRRRPGKKCIEGEIDRAYWKTTRSINNSKRWKRLVHRSAIKKYGKTRVGETKGVAFVNPPARAGDAGNGRRRTRGGPKESSDERKAPAKGRSNPNHLRRTPLKKQVAGKKSPRQSNDTTAN